MLCYSICPITNRGSGLIANRLIFQNELIFFDTPLVSSTTARQIKRGEDEHDDKDHQTMNSDEYCAHCANKLGILGEVLNPSISCPGGCPLAYCSALCIEHAERKGHRWLCTSYLTGSINNLYDSNADEYIVLALMIISQIAQQMFQNRLLSVESATENILSGFTGDDYCRNIHAFRCGLKPVDEVLFETLIAPAYFEAYLRYPMETIRAVFFGNQKELWGQDSAAIERSREFLESNIFTAEFTRRLFGIFAVNNLQVQLSNTASASSTATSGIDIPSAVPSVASSLLGTGLYPLYSKMNHECVCNTFNRLSDVPGVNRNEVSVFASRDIQAGEEITTTYLHGIDPPSSSRRSRLHQLRKYLFKCVCPLCEQQKRRRAPVIGVTGFTSSDSESASSSEESS